MSNGFVYMTWHHHSPIPITHPHSLRAPPPRIWEKLTWRASAALWGCPIPVLFCVYSRGVHWAGGRHVSFVAHVKCSISRRTVSYIAVNRMKTYGSHRSVLFLLFWRTAGRNALKGVLVCHALSLFRVSVACTCNYFTAFVYGQREALYRASSRRFIAVGWWVTFQ